MKVLSIIDSADLYGKERANLQVAHILKGKGYDVTVVINSIANKAIREEVKDFKVKEIEFPRNIEGNHRTLRFIKAFAKTQFAFKQLVSELSPDYILIPTEIAMAYLYIPLACAKSKVVFRCGDSPIVFRKKGLGSKVYGCMWKYLFVRRVDKLVCNAKFIQDQIKMSGRKACAFDRIIYNYPPLRVNTTDSANYLPNDKSLRVGFMGRIVKEKGVYEMCEAAIISSEKNCPITLYIGGNTNVDKDYITLIQGLLKKNSRNKSRIVFLGNVNDLQKFYDNVDIVCIPSIYEEPMANVVTEAKMNHKLSVIFNQGGMPEIISHLENGYICNKVSSAALADSFIYYSLHRDEVGRQGDKAYDSIEELGLSEGKFTQKWLEVFS